MQCIIKQSGKPSNQTRTGFTTNAGVEGTADLTKELLLFKNIFKFIFRERGREGEKEGEKHQCAVASCVPPTGGPDLQPRHAL